MLNFWCRGLLVSVGILMPGQLLAVELTAGDEMPMCKRVLFVGNSLTNENSLPSLFEAYVDRAYPAEAVCTGVMAKPGATLTAHRRGGEVAKRIAHEHWDYVVLQAGRDVAPGGTFNGQRWYGYPEAFLSSVEYFVDVVRASGAEPVLLETWGVEDRAMRFVRHAYVLAHSNTGVLVAPVGDVLQKLGGTRGFLQKDKIHPSVRGSTVMAITLATTILGPPAPVDPVELEELTIAEVETVQRFAANGFETNVVQEPLEYVPVPVLKPVDELNLQDGERWQARFPSLRYSLGAILEVGDGSPRLRLYTFAPSGRVNLPLESMRGDDRELKFETVSGGVRYSVQIVREGRILRVMTSYKSDETHRNFATAEFSRSKDNAYFETLDKLYSDLDASEKEIGLAKALRGHYQRLEALVGHEGMTKALSGFELDEWDCIMLAWQYQEAGNTRRALDYLEAATKLFPSSVDAVLALAEGYRQNGQTSEALKILSSALRDHSYGQKSQERIKRKINSLSS